MGEGPVFVQRYSRPPRGRIVLGLVAIGLLIAVAVLNLATPGFQQQDTGSLLRLWPLFLAAVLAGMACLQALQLRATLNAAHRQEVLYRFDEGGAHFYPVLGRPRTIAWDKLQRIRRTKNALFLMGRSPSGQRVAFVASLAGTDDQEALDLVRRYRPDLGTEIQGP